MELLEQVFQTLESQEDNPIETEKQREIKDYLRSDIFDITNCPYSTKDLVSMFEVFNYSYIAYERKVENFFYDFLQIPSEVVETDYI